MTRQSKINKYFAIIRDNNFFVITYEITKRILLFIYSIFCTCYTWIKLKGNGVVFSTFRTHGVPMIDVKIGGKFTIGKNFRMNNGKYYNKIGRQQQSSFVVAKGSFLSFGDNVGLSSSSFFCSQRISVGNNVMIGGNCVFYDTDFHSLNFLERRDGKVDEEKSKSLPVIIEDDVFIGAHSTILKGVTIGKGSIIGAASLVSKSIPPNEIWGGNPVNFIKRLSIEET
jgi:acetyltransferase-like isoleucine patch superfamily enzyme